VEEILHGPAKLTGDEHAAVQLARAFDELELKLGDTAARLYPSAADREFAATFLRGDGAPTIALHPGSGGERKNWPLELWLALAEQLVERGSLLFIGGEADQARLAAMRARFQQARVVFAENLPLPHLAAVLERAAIFVGHDSGISHIAAAVGTPSVLLFGPTDPAIWAPTNEKVCVIRAPNGDLAQLGLRVVFDAVDQELMRIGISTYRNGV
jgi:heptosyltransferase-2